MYQINKISEAHAKANDYQTQGLDNYLVRTVCTNTTRAACYPSDPESR